MECVQEEEKGFLSFHCGGGSSRHSLCTCPYLQKEWVRGIYLATCHATAPNYLSLLCLVLHSWRFVLPQKHISAPTTLSVGKGLLGAHFTLPLSHSFPSSPTASFPESSPLSALPVCHSSLLMRGRDQQSRPLEFDKSTCCVSTSPPLKPVLSSLLPRSLSLASISFPFSP